MPFTASHAAVVVPLARRGLILSALVVGSMAPDLEYFLRLSFTSRYGHTLPGMFALSLPCGLAALWLFHAILKRPLLTLLPASHEQRLARYAGPFHFAPARRFARILVSLMAGIVSHVVIDAFTHEHGQVVDMIPMLGVPVGRIGGLVVPAYMALQAAATAVLSLVLLGQYWRWFRREPPAGDAPPFALERQLLVLFGFGSLAALLGFGYGALGVRHLSGFDALHVFGGRAFIAAAATLGLELFVFAVAMRWQADRAATLQASPATTREEGFHED